MYLFACMNIGLYLCTRIDVENLLIRSVVISINQVDITYKDEKGCNCYRDLMKNPTDRICIKNFTKKFCKEIINPAIKLHDRLEAFGTASEYNKVFGNTNNRIEKKSGTGDKESLVLKVRITDSYRKFFYFIPIDKDSAITTEEWNGQFNEVNSIHVFEINKHNYDKV